jgi:hypothetical protein
MSRPLTANSRNEAEMMSKAKRQQTMAQDPLGMYSLSLSFLFIFLAKVHFNFYIEIIIVISLLRVNDVLHLN